MKDITKGPDIAQRIFEALARTSEPWATSEYSLFNDFSSDDGEIIGTVPFHLRHLHNLVDELNYETDGTEDIDCEKLRRFDNVRSIFFDALRTHLPEHTGADAIVIIKNWDVMAMYPPNDEKERDSGILI